ncbi:MAG TPA: DUF1801 domain-containing protein [Candidatus Bilamarchaeum sp.]|nr:DUF1801 domain-containing protein [Candidatus Bilamarchaeum sp.]
MKKAANVDSYIASAPKEVQGKLRELRKAIKSAAPDAEEKISYGMPYYHYNGRLIYFGIAKAHIGLYIPTPVLEMHRKELAGYDTSNAATVRFPLGRKLPVALIRKLVRARMKLNDKSVAGKKVKFVKRHSDGSVWAKGTMLNGKMEGYWQFFRKGGGAIMRSGYFKKGKQTGKWTTYDSKGKAFKVTDMGE